MVHCGKHFRSDTSLDPVPIFQLSSVKPHFLQDQNCVNIGNTKSHGFQSMAIIFTAIQIFVVVNTSLQNWIHLP
jgi:hypothetical protein